jgi:hypothetical protein
LGTRLPSPRPVVPSSPVRVAIWVRRFDMIAAMLAARSVGAAASYNGWPVPATEEIAMNAPLPAHLLPKIEPRAVPKEMVEALKAQFGERCSTALVVREQHGRDESPIDAPPPEAVVFCESTEDVAFVVKLADRHAVPVIPFGVGSSLEGHLLAVQGGVSIDLSRMNKVLAVNAEDLTVTVPGRGDPDPGQRRDPPHRASSFRSTRAPTPRSAACAPPVPAAPTRSATARCARTRSA